MAITSVVAGTSGTFGATAPSVTAMNGTYTVYSTWNSASQYSNGAAYIGFNGSSWVWSSVVNGGGTVYATNSSSSTTVPASGWSGSGNPTLAAITTGLATSYTTTNTPGTSSAIGTYVPVSGANAVYNYGSTPVATQYCNGTVYGAWAYSQWSISTTPNYVGPGDLYSSPYPTASTVFPLTGWEADTGASPAPTFSTAPTALNGNFLYMF